MAEAKLRTRRAAWTRKTWESCGRPSAFQNSQPMAFPKLKVDPNAASMSQLVRALSESPGSANCRRLWAMVHLLSGLDEGESREEFARCYGIGSRQLRVWIHKFNEGGIPG